MKTIYPSKVFAIQCPLVSVNKWKVPVARGRHASMYVTKEYREFKETICNGITFDVPFEKKVDVTLILFANTRKDTDGPIKGIFDALELSGIIPNDRMIRDLYVERYYSKEEGVIIMINESEDEDRKISIETFLKEKLNEY